MRRIWDKLKGNQEDTSPATPPTAEEWEKWKRDNPKDPKQVNDYYSTDRKAPSHGNGPK